MVLTQHNIAAAAFEEFVQRPENAARHFELISGEMVEKMVTNTRSSKAAANILFFMRLFMEQNHILGHVTGADGGFQVGSERYIPDVGYISKARQPDYPDAAYNPLPPDLAVEVLSPSDEAAPMRIKMGNYLAVGTVLWLVDPQRQTVEVYAPGQSVITYTSADALEGGQVLPGFKLPLAKIFAE